jgi:hypothetical protein
MSVTGSNEGVFIHSGLRRYKSAATFFIWLSLISSQVYGESRSLKKGTTGFPYMQIQQQIQLVCSGRCGGPAIEFPPIHRSPPSAKSFIIRLAVCLSLLHGKMWRLTN